MSDKTLSISTSKLQDKIVHSRRLETNNSPNMATASYGDTGQLSVGHPDIVLYTIH